MSAGFAPSEAEFAGDVDEAEKARRLHAAAPMVRAMCASRLRGRDSEDAAQDVLERVWRAQHQQEFDEEGVRRYAAALARVVPPNYDRRSVRSSPVGELGEHLWVDGTPGPEGQYDRSEAVADAAARVQALLERLSPREREIIQATHLGERSTAEVAAELGLTPSGVRSAQTRAMARMRETEQTRSRNPLASELPERERQRAARMRLVAEMPDGPQGRRAAEAAQRFASEQGRLPSRSELVERSGVGSGTAQRVVRALHEQQGTPGVTPPARDVTSVDAQQYGRVHSHRPSVAAPVEGIGDSARDRGDDVRRGRGEGSGVDRADDRATDHVADRTLPSSSAAPSARERAETVDDQLGALSPVTTDRAPHSDDGREPFGGRDPLDDARVAVGRASVRAGSAEVGSGAEDERREQLALWRLDDLHAAPQDREHDTGDLDTDAAASSGGLR